MPKKLHLKRTPADLPKAKKKFTQSARRRRPSPPEPKRQRRTFENIESSDDASEGGFWEKLADALEEDDGDDERLDSIEANLNDYAHVPKRWKEPTSADVDPQYMSDESYAEWIRAGMWKKKHAAEYAEQQHQQSLKDAQRLRKRQLKAESASLEKAAGEKRKRKRAEKERRRMVEAREMYDARWKEVLGGKGELAFRDVPWPVMSAYESKTSDLTEENISAFLESKDRLRETLLRFHPDKFEGRVMGRVQAGEQEKVRDALGQVVRVVNSLMHGYIAPIRCKD